MPIAPMNAKLSTIDKLRKELLDEWDKNIVELLKLRLKYKQCESDLAAANAIIEKLPLTADKVRVVPGLREFVFHTSGHELEPCWCEGDVWKAFGSHDSKGLYPYDMEKCYSTPEAAQEAADAPQ